MTSIVTALTNCISNQTSVFGLTDIGDTYTDYPLLVETQSEFLVRLSSIELCESTLASLTGLRATVALIDPKTNVTTSL